MNVLELYETLGRLVDAGHGEKTVGFPEGLHANGVGAGESLSFRVEEIATDDSAYAGFVWIDVESAARTRRKACCLDCGKPYAEFGLDVVLPRSQWLEIHPEDSGLLCASCIVQRASALDGSTACHLTIEILSSRRTGAKP